LARTYADEGLSGKRADNRPGLQGAIAHACETHGVLVVYSLSRLARSTRDAIDIAERLAKCKADLVSITEKIDTTTSMGRKCGDDSEATVPRGLTAKEWLALASEGGAGFGEAVTDWGN
jgi:DNA invertase Pin-like site-specific DNA recombinase